MFIVRVHQDEPSLPAMLAKGRHNRSSRAEAVRWIPPSANQIVAPSGVGGA